MLAISQHTRGLVAAADPLPFWPALFGIIAVSAGGVWLAYIVIGWITKPRQ